MGENAAYTSGRPRTLTSFTTDNDIARAIINPAQVERRTINSMISEALRQYPGAITLVYETLKDRLYVTDDSGVRADLLAAVAAQSAVKNVLYPEPNQASISLRWNERDAANWIGYLADATNHYILPSKRQAAVGALVYYILSEIAAKMPLARPCAVIDQVNEEVVFLSPPNAYDLSSALEEIQPAGKSAAFELQQNLTPESGWFV